MNIGNRSEECSAAWGRSPLARMISPAFLLLGRLVARRLERALVEGGLDLTPAQVRVLLALHFQGPLTQATLALHTGVDPSTLVSTLDVMEREGTASREPVPGDRRAHLVTPTERGEAKVPRLFELWDGVETEMTREMTAEDRRLLTEVLKDLIGRLCEGDPPCG